MKRLGVIIASVLLVAATGPAWCGEMKVGFVDLQRALNESNAGKEAREQFIDEMERLQVNLRNEKEAVDRLREEFDKKAMLLRDKERLAMEQKLEDSGLAFKRKYEDYQRKLKRTDNEYTGSILRELEGVIRETGAEEGYTLIVEVQSSGILYGNPEADLTDRIISKYNERPSGVEKRARKQKK